SGVRDNYSAQSLSDQKLRSSCELVRSRSAAMAGELPGALYPMARPVERPTTHEHGDKTGSALVRADGLKCCFNGCLIRRSGVFRASSTWLVQTITVWNRDRKSRALADCHDPGSSPPHCNFSKTPGSWTVACRNPDHKRSSR